MFVCTQIAGCYNKALEGLRPDLLFAGFLLFECTKFKNCAPITSFAVINHFRSIYSNFFNEMACEKTQLVLSGTQFLFQALFQFSINRL